MKLETEPVFHHLKVSHKSSSKRIEYDHNPLDSDGKNTVEKTMKENGNGHFGHRDGEKDADELPFKNNVASDELMPSKTEHPVRVDGSDNAKAVKDQDSAVTPTQLVTETKFGEDPDKLYTDKDVTESELPEVIVCYKESTEHVVKDICVDEALPCMDKIVFEDVTEEVKSGIPCTLPENKHGSELTKEVSETSMATPDKIEQRDITKQCNSTDLTQSAEAKCDTAGKVDNDHFESLVKETGAEKSNGNSSASASNEVEQDTTQTSDEKAELGGPAAISSTGESNNDIPEVIPSIQKPSGSEDSEQITPSEELSHDNKEESSRVTSDSETSTPAASSGGEFSQNESPKTSESHTSSGIEDRNVESRLITNRIHNSLGDSSFSMAGPLSGRLNYVDPMPYSGNIDPVPYSGSLSMRSDSSTTSARSFAFPVLQSEWNSSPVRMAKANRRNRRWDRRLRSLLCCKS